MGNLANETQLEFAEILKDLIESAKKTQSRVAEEIDISAATLSKYVNYEGSAEELGMSCGILLKLAKYFDVPITYFFEKSVNPEKPVRQKKAVDDEDFSMECSELPTELILESSDNIKSNPLINIFENAIDKYHIDYFIDYDFSFTPLDYKDIEAISDFIWDLRSVLPSFRRSQDSTRKNVIDFINTIEEYLAYLGEQMGSEDGVKFYRLHNIDLDMVNENVGSFRRTLNEIYGLITDGGTLSIYM